MRVFLSQRCQLAGTSSSKGKKKKRGEEIYFEIISDF